MFAKTIEVECERQLFRISISTAVFLSAVLHLQKSGKMPCRENVCFKKECADDICSPFYKSFYGTAITACPTRGIRMAIVIEKPTPWPPPPPQKKKYEIHPT